MRRDIINKTYETITVTTARGPLMFNEIGAALRDKWPALLKQEIITNATRRILSAYLIPPIRVTEDTVTCKYYLLEIKEH